MQSHELKKSVVVHNSALAKFKEFWNMPLEQVIQEIIDGKENRIILRFIHGIERSASPEDKEAINKKIAELSTKKDKSANEWCALGVCYQRLERANKPGFEAKMLDCYRRADEMGSGEGAHELSRYYDLIKDTERAEQYLERALARGCAIAHFTHALNLENRGLKEEAKRYFDIAADKGEANGILRRTAGYGNMIVAAKDSKEAAVAIKNYQINLELQVAQGSSYALIILANNYLNGDNGYHKNFAHGIYLHRCAAEAQRYYGIGGNVSTLWYKFVKPAGQHESQILLYHMAYLYSMPPARAIMKVEFKYASADEIRLTENLPAAICTLARENFELVDQLSDNDPWEIVKNVFADAKEAEHFYQRKRRFLAEKVKYLMRGERPRKAPVSYDLAKMILKLNGVHDCYFINMETLLAETPSMEAKVLDKTTRKEQAACAQLFALVNDHLKFLKNKIVKQLAKDHFLADEKCAEIYRKKRLAEVFNHKDVDSLDFDAVDQRIKNNRSLMHAYAELRAVAQFYGLVSEKNTACYINKLKCFNTILHQSEAAALELSGPGFFGNATTAELKLLFQRAHDILAPFFMQAMPTIAPQG